MTPADGVGKMAIRGVTTLETLSSSTLRDTIILNCQSRGSKKKNGCRVSGGSMADISSNNTLVMKTSKSH